MSKADRAGWRFLLRALQHRNYRLFFGGQGVSLIGTWMTRIATSWLVFRLAEPKTAALLLGIVSFMGQIPTFFLSPFAGVWIDRWNRHRVLVWTQVISMIQSFLLAAAAGIAQSHTAVIVELVALNFIQGVVNAFDIPGRQSFLVEMVNSREDLPNAIALNSSMVNGARLLGPSLAGIIIAAVGEVWCFLIDGFSYLAVIAALLAMQVPRAAAVAKWGPWRAEMAEGIRYAWGFLPVRAILAQLASISFLSMASTVLMPIFADRLEAGSPRILGFLMAAIGVGSLAGALYLASRRSVVGLGRVIVFCTSVFGVAQLAFAASHTLPLSLVTAALSGFGMMVQMAAGNTILQTIVEDRLRGRLMSLYTVAFMGMTPFGSLFAGVLSHAIGAPATVGIAGALSLVTALRFRSHLRLIRADLRAEGNQASGNLN